MVLPHCVVNEWQETMEASPAVGSGISRVVLSLEEVERVIDSRYLAKDEVLQSSSQVAFAVRLFSTLQPGVP